MEVHGRQPSISQEAQDRIQRQHKRRGDVDPGHGKQSSDKATDPSAEGYKPGLAGHVAQPVAPKTPVLRSAGNAQHLQTDVVELSEAGEALAHSEDPARLERVSDLKRQHENGTLLTHRRFEQAAAGILRG